MKFKHKSLLFAFPFMYLFIGAYIHNHYTKHICDHFKPGSDCGGKIDVIAWPFYAFVEVMHGLGNILVFVIDQFIIAAS